MSRRLAGWCVVVVVAGWCSASSAHHSISVVETGKPVWVTGTVVEYVVRRPHVTFYLQMKRV